MNNKENITYLKKRKAGLVWKLQKLKQEREKTNKIMSWSNDNNKNNSKNSNKNDDNKNNNNYYTQIHNFNKKKNDDKNNNQKYHQNYKLKQLDFIYQKEYTKIEDDIIKIDKNIIEQLHQENKYGILQQIGLFVGIIVVFALFVLSLHSFQNVSNHIPDTIRNSEESTLGKIIKNSVGSSQISTAAVSTLITAEEKEPIPPEGNTSMPWGGGLSLQSGDISIQGSGGNATATSCGYMNKNIVLTADLDNESTCIIINASDLNLNCDGHIIKYAMTNKGHAINNSNAFNNITIQNCIIITGKANSSHGINLNNSFGSNITNNSIYTNGTNDNYGVYASNSTNLTVNNNTIYTTGTGIKNIGIVFNNSDYSNITDNYIYTNGTNLNYGIFLTSNSSHNFLGKNNIRTRGSTSSNIGIFVTSNSVSNTISNNTIITNGTSVNYGIELTTTSNDNVIDNNTIRTNGVGGGGGNNYGIYLLTVSGNITNNYINTNGAGTNYGIRLATSANNSLVSHNIIYTNGSAASNYGISLDNGGNNSIEYNTIYTNGTNDNKGISISTRCDYNNINSNVIRTNGDAGANKGISIYASKENNVTNNDIVTKTSTNANNHDGIIITDSKNMLIEKNNITANIGLGTKGIYFDNVSSSVINNNIIRTNGTGSSNNGIEMQGDLNSEMVFNNITNNNISTWGTTFNRGIYLYDSVNKTIISNNRINTSGSSTTNIGIFIEERSGQNNINNNIINTNGTTDNYGIQLFKNSTHNLIDNNEINSKGSSSTNYGIYLFNDTSNNNITNNLINTNGTTFNHGIILKGYVNNTVIDNNKIITRGSSNNRGIDIEIESDHNLVNNNSLDTKATTINNYGIYIALSFFNNLTNNNITTNGTSNNYGIYLNVSNNTWIKNNNITAQGSSNPNYAIYIYNSSNNSFINNNVTSNSNQEYDFFDQSGANSPNYLIYNNSFGEIRWTNLTVSGSILPLLENLTLNITNSDGLGLGRNLFIGNNTIALNTTAFNGGVSLINSSANITLYNPNFTNVTTILFLHNFTLDPSIFAAKGSICEGSNCTILDYSNTTGILRFNVTFFSSYSANGTRPSTGDEPSNSRPTTPGLINPANSSTTTNLTPAFRWYNSTDADADPITYNIVVDTNAAFNNPVINVTNINPTANSINTSYDAQTELSIDTLYYWKVAANDSTGYGTWSSTSNFTVQSFISLSITTSTVDFGTLSLGDRASTNTSGFALPFRAINNGNILMNITINGTEYFTNATFPGPNYKYRIQPNMTGSFDTARSDQNWTNMTRTGVEKIINLDWHSISNDFVTDINITVPVDEPPGVKTSTVSFVGSG